LVDAGWSSCVYFLVTSHWSIDGATLFGKETSKKSNLRFFIWFQSVGGAGARARVGGADVRTNTASAYQKMTRSAYFARFFAFSWPGPGALASADPWGAGHRHRIWQRRAAQRRRSAARRRGEEPSFEPRSLPGQQRKHGRPNAGRCRDI